MFYSYGGGFGGLKFNSTQICNVTSSFPKNYIIYNFVTMTNWFSSSYFYPHTFIVREENVRRLFRRTYKNSRKFCPAFSGNDISFKKIFLFTKMTHYISKKSVKFSFSFIFNPQKRNMIITN